MGSAFRLIDSVEYQRQVVADVHEWASVSWVFHCRILGTHHLLRQSLKLMGKRSGLSTARTDAPAEIAGVVKVSALDDSSTRG